MRALSAWAFRDEHEIHQADCGKHAGFLQQEDNVGDKRWEAQRNCLRKHYVTHGLQFRKAQADSALTLDGLHVFQASTERFGHVGAAVQCKANVIFLLKETSVFSAISLMDLMFVTKDLMGLYYKTTECLVMLVAFYLIILVPVSVAGTYIERRLRHGSFGA